MKIIKQFLLFVLFFLGALCNSAVAQSSNDSAEQFKDTLLMQNVCEQQNSLGGDPTIDDIVEALDKAFSATKEVKMHCVRRGNLICLEQDVTASEYDDIKTAMETCGWLVKKLMKKALSSDKKTKETFRSLAKQGYYFAYSVKCGNNEPVIIELDF